MSLPLPSPEIQAHLPSKALLAEVHTFLSSNYEFWCNEKYKGFWGKLRYFSDWYDAVEREKSETGERYDMSGFQEPETYYSSPYGKEAFKELLISALIIKHAPLS